MELTYTFILSPDYQISAELGGRVQAYIDSPGVSAAFTTQVNVESTLVK